MVGVIGPKQPGGCCGFEHVLIAFELGQHADPLAFSISRHVAGQPLICEGPFDA